MARIGIDLDGCLANFNDAYTALLTKESGVEFPPTSDEWPTEWYYDRPEGVSAAHRSAAWEVIKSTDFWGRLTPLEGALDSLQRLNILRATGHDIYFITSRPGKMAKFYTEEWLRLSGMQNPTVLIASNKGPVAQGLELDVFVDDKPENLNDVAEARAEVRAYLVDRPYNRTYLPPLCGGGVRVKSVGEMLDIEFPLTQLRRAA